MSDVRPDAGDVFDEAADLLPSERDRFLEDACGSDTALLEEVRSLLASHDAMGDFLDGSAAQVLGESAEVAFAPGTRVGNYELEDRIGSGGSGAVYRARQDRPRRVVALKFLRARLLSDRAVQAFETEAEILARLDHPGVAHVYEAGLHEHGGTRTPFYALEYVDGAQSITRFAHAQRVDRRARVDLVARVADAVHFAHQRGVIHLDLKPGNVLVGADGRPKIIDFGIARTTDTEAAAPSHVTGTLAYMSPEQAAGDNTAIDVRTDVYALGVLLYELLSGELPIAIDGADVTASLQRVQDAQATPLCARDSSQSRELSAVVDRAIAKDRDQRYASAAALADDLRRFLRHEPVSAVPRTPLYQLRKFARRQPLAAGSAVALLVVLVGATVVSMRLAVERAEQAQKAEHKAYLADIVASQAAIDSADVGAARTRLASIPAERRGWEWRLLWNRLDQSRTSFSWEGPATQSAALHPSGEAIAVFGTSAKSTSDIRVLSVPGGALQFALPGEYAHAVRYSPDGRHLACAQDSEVAIWDVDDRTEPVRITPHEDRVNSVSWHPSRPWILTGSSDGTVALSDVEQRTVVRRFAGHTDRVVGVAVSPDGAFAASAGRDGDVRIWNLGSGACAAVLQGHQSSVEQVAWSADTRRVASVSRDGSVRMWEVATEQQLWARHEHTGVVRDVTFVPRSELLATASWDGTVRLWDAPTGSPRGRLAGHGDRVMAIFAPIDGSALVSLAQNGTVKTWDPAPHDDIPTLRGQRGQIHEARFSPDGGTVVTCSRMGTVWAWDTGTRHGRQVHDYGATSGRYSVHFTSTAEFQLARAGAITTIDLAANAADALPPKRIPATLSRVADQRWHGQLIAASGYRELFAYDPTEARERRVIGKSDDFVGALAVHAARGTAVSISEGGVIEWWDLRAGKRVRTARGRDVEAIAGAARPNAAQVAFAYRDGTVEIRRTEDARVVATLDAHTNGAHCLAFSPDGSRLATGGSDGVVRIWETTNYDQTLALDRGEVTVWSVAWSPDGTQLVAGHGTWDSPATISLWTARPTSGTDPDSNTDRGSDPDSDAE